MCLIYILTRTWLDHDILLLLISRKVLKMGTAFWHNLDSSLKIVLSKFGSDIFDGLEIMRFSAAQQIW